MRPSRRWTLLFAAAFLPLPAGAQRHSGLSSPPTAPPSFAQAGHTPAATTQIMAMSSGLGAIQFYPVNYGTVAPQSLTRQLAADDERIRQSALQALGVPSMYTVRGHVPFPRSTQLQIAPMSPGGDMDALLTVELDHHLVTAVLMPQNGDWKRIATIIFPTETADPSTTPGTFVHLTRSVVEPNRYRAVFLAREVQPNGDVTENEAHLRVFNNRALITTSFVSESRQCENAPGTVRSGETCQITERWLQPDTSQPGTLRFTMVAASGTVAGRDASSLLASSRTFGMAHLKNYTCQEFMFSDASLRYEPAGPAGSCGKKPAGR